MSLLLALQGGGTPQTGTPGAASRSWVIPAFAVLLGAVTAQPATAARQWTVPAASVAVGGVVATPLPATRTWIATTPAVSLGGVVASPAPAVRTWTATTPAVALGGVSAAPLAAASTWSVPQVGVSLALTVTPGPAVWSWVALDAVLLEAAGQTGTPLPAVSTWVVPTATFSALAESSGGGGSFGPQRYPKKPGYHVTVTVPPAIREWVVPRVRVALAVARIPDPARRDWRALEPDVLVAPDPDEEALILLLAEGL